MKKLTVKEIIEDLNHLSMGDIADSILLYNLISKYEKRLEKEETMKKTILNVNRKTKKVIKK